MTTMRVFRFQNPLDTRFAQAGRLGTWYPEPASKVCPECGASRQRRVPPLVIEWLPGSDVIGDFAWPGGEVVVRQRVREVFEKSFYGFGLRAVEVRESINVEPPMYELWATTQVPADSERSAIYLSKVCSTCGIEFYEVAGTEVRKRQWDTTKKQLVEVHTPLEEGKGIYVRREDLQGADSFHLREFPQWIFCTEPVKALVEAEQFTNVSFLEMGVVVE